jgi:1,4-dihydroxy-2-naphthoate octaprenyltransferase
VDDLLTRRQTRWIAAAGYAATVAVGLAIAFAREPGVLPLGLVGIALAFGYHAAPVRLSYRGLGELAVAFCYGPLVVVGTYLVQRGRTQTRVVGASLPLGLLIAAFLIVNEFPDARADAGAGKRTLVVRLGPRRSTRLFAGVIGMAFALTVALPLLGAPAGIWFGTIGLPPAVGAVRRLFAGPPTTAAIVPAQRLALLAFVLFAIGGGAGLALFD